MTDLLNLSSKFTSFCLYLDKIFTERKYNAEHRCNSINHLLKALKRVTYKFHVFHNQSSKTFKMIQFKASTHCAFYEEKKVTERFKSA